MATKKKTTAPEVVEETKVTEEVVEQPIAEVEEKPVQAKKVKTPTSGTVTGCEQLNVRNAASKVATRIAVIPKGTEFEVTSFEAGSKWVGISTKTGIKGFVMAEFVTVK